MTNHVPRTKASRLAAADRRIGAWLRNRHRRRRTVGFHRRYGDNGYVLLETLVAISLISVVMAGFTTFFVNSVAFTNLQRATQAATMIANSALDTIRAAPPSDLLVTGATAGVPATQTVNNVVYGVAASFGACAIQTGVKVNGVTVNPNCVSSASGIQYLRAVVTVTWTGSRCPPTKCQYVTSTLVSPVDDPLFNQNQAPPAAPVLNSPGAQISAVGDSINLPVIFTAVPTAVFTITAMPAGLVLNSATGVISGTVSAVTATTTLTMLLTDGFGRIATTSFSWTVGPGLTATNPADQASVLGVAIIPLIVSAAAGTLGYTWSDPGATLPTGLTLSTVGNQATITGTPTGVGAFPSPFAVKLTVTDSKARTAIVSFSWTVGYPPFVAASTGSQTSTVGAPDTVPLSVTGGSGSVVWSSATLPAGITLTAAGVLAGTPTTAGVTSVTLLVVDAKAGAQQTVTFTWTVYPRPAVASPGDQTITVGQSVTLSLTKSCPNTPCTYVMNGGPATFVIDGNGVLTGTVTSAPHTFSAVTFTVTDNSLATATSAAFAVVVNPAPTISSPGNLTTASGAVASLNVAALAGGGTAPLTYSATNLPAWLTLNTSTGLITGTAPNSGGSMNGVVLTVTDVRGVSASSTAFNWTVFGTPSEPLGVVVVNGDGTVTATWTAPATGTATSYTATLSPGGASCTTAGLSCPIGGLTDGVPYSLTVTATNSYGTSPASTAVTAIPYPAILLASNSNLTLWLDGADPAVKFSDSSSACTGSVATTAIGCWEDKSATGENFIQTVDVNRPGIATWNGLPAANFVDTTDVLNSIRATNQYQTVFVAANITNGSNGSNGVQGTYVDLFGQGNTTSPSIGTDYDVRVGSGVGRSSADHPNVNDWSFNSTNTGWQFEWAKGVQGAQVNVPAAVITSDISPGVNTFAANVSNTFMSRGVVGQVGDVITLKTALTDQQRHSVEQYLSNKWMVPITPAMVPQPPSAVVGVASGANGAAISWAAPRFNGGAAVSGYTVTSTPGNRTCTTNGALLCTVPGLTSGTYTFAVTATNSVGAGPASSPSLPVAR